MRRFYQPALLLVAAIWTAAAGRPAPAVPGEPLGVSLYCLADPVVPGGGGTLQIVVTNNSQFDLEEIEFTIDLEGALPGLRGADATPEEDPCGEGSVMHGEGGRIRLEKGQLGRGGGECNFWVALAIPQGAPWPKAIPITAGEIEGRGPAGEVLEGVAAEDDLDVVAPWGQPACPTDTLIPCMLASRFF